MRADRLICLPRCDAHNYRIRRRWNYIREQHNIQTRLAQHARIRFARAARWCIAAQWCVARLQRRHSPFGVDLAQVRRWSRPVYVMMSESFHLLLALYALIATAYATCVHSTHKKLRTARLLMMRSISRARTFMDIGIGKQTHSGWMQCSMESRRAVLLHPNPIWVCPYGASPRSSIFNTIIIKLRAMCFAR